MATKQTKDKTPRRRKMPQTIREHAEKQARKRNTGSSKLRSRLIRPLNRPARLIKKAASSEYHPIKLPDNKVGRLLGKRGKLMPSYFKNSWAELKQVNWPSRKDAAKLTSAVFIFAIIFAVFIQILDLIFNRLVKVIFLK